MAEKPLGRRRRRITDQSEPQFDYLEPSVERGELSTTKKTQNTQQLKSDDALSLDYPNQPSLSSSDRLQLDLIYAELTEEEQYYSAEMDYSDDTHNWSDDGDELVSNDYWHFLGRYEWFAIEFRFWLDISWFLKA